MLSSAGTGQPAELSSISGQLRHGFMNVTKLQRVPIKATETPHAMYLLLFGPLMALSNHAGGREKGRLDVLDEPVWASGSRHPIDTTAWGQLGACKTIPLRA